MVSVTEQERQEHEEIQKRMVSVAKKLLESKRQLQQEIRDDIQKPEVQAAVLELKKRRVKHAE